MLKKWMIEIKILLRHKWQPTDNIRCGIVHPLGLDFDFFQGCMHPHEIKSLFFTSECANVGAGPLQLCGCDLWQAVLERYWRLFLKSLIWLQIFRNHVPEAQYVQWEFPLAQHKLCPWAEKSNVTLHSSSLLMALIFHNSRVRGPTSFRLSIACLLCISSFNLLTISSVPTEIKKMISLPLIMQLSQIVAGMVPVFVGWKRKKERGKREKGKS